MYICCKYVQRLTLKTYIYDPVRLMSKPRLYYYDVDWSWLHYLYCVAETSSVRLNGVQN